MANIGADYFTDQPDGPLVPGDELTRSQPIPGIVHGAITGINGVVSPGLWDGADVSGVGFVPGLAGTKKVLGGAVKRVGGALENLTADPYLAPDEAKNQPPVDDQPQTISQSLATGRAPKGSLADNVDTWSKGAQPFNSYGAATAPANARPPAASSDDDPNSQIATHPLERGDPEPTRQQPNSGFVKGSPESPAGLPGMLGKLFDNISSWRDQNRLTLLAMAGGLAGSQSIGQGIGRGFTAAASVQPQQFAMNNQNATAAFLQNHGMDPNLSRSVASNPALMQEVIGQMTGIQPPKTMAVPGLIGSSLMQWNPQTRKWEPASGIGGGGVGAGGDVPPAQWDAMTPEQRLATLDPAIAEGVKAIGEGRAMVPNRLAALMPIAAKVYGNGFNQTSYQTALRTQNDFAPNGVSGKNITAIETALGHIDRMRNAADQLGNFTIMPSLNAPYNAARGQLDPDYQRKVAAFEATATGSSGELAKAFRSAGMSEADIDRWSKLFDKNSSPETIKAAADEGMHMLDSRLDAISDSYNRGMPPAAPKKTAMDFLSGPARAIHDRIIGGGQQAPQAQAAPQAAPQQVPPPQQRQVGQVYPTPRGPMRWMADGWHPVQ